MLVAVGIFFVLWLFVVWNGFKLELTIGQWHVSCELYPLKRFFVKGLRKQRLEDGEDE